MRIGSELAKLGRVERKGMVGQWKADRGRGRLVRGGGGVRRRAVLGEESGK